MSRSGKRWTLGDISYLRSGYRIGHMSADSMATYLERSPAAVRAKIERLRRSRWWHEVATTRNV